MPNPVTWFEVAGKDYEATKKFYVDLFGWKIEDMEGAPQNYGAIDTGGDLPGGIGEAPEGNPGHVTFYVSVDDLAASLAKAEELGGKKVFDPMDIPNGQIAMFTDPEGRSIGLMKMNG